MTIERGKLNVHASLVQRVVVNCLKSGDLKGAAECLPELTVTQAAALVAGKAELRGNSAEGITFVDL